jgi:hypothetical protein
MGRIVRDNQEILLHSYALIKGFFDPENHKISDLPLLYKDYIKDFSTEDVFAFVQELCDYASTYRKHFEIFDASTTYTFGNIEQRLFHVLDRCDVSTLHPYILKLFKDNESVNGDAITETLAGTFKKIESYVLRHTLCRVTTKNFNKECQSLIRGDKTLDRLFVEKSDSLNDNAVKIHLKQMPSNKIASLILFLIELHRMYQDNKASNNQRELKYDYSLEHVMPQKWKEYWGLDALQACYPDTGERVEDVNIAEDLRNHAVYEIGNMTLLTSRLNTSLRNYTFTKKMEGEGRKKGIKNYADLSVAKDIVESYDTRTDWNEFSIRERTNRLTSEFLSVW